jgi:hypothetical protein
MAEQTAAELRKQREREAREAALIKGGDDRPPSTDLSTILGPQEPPADTPTAEDAEAAPAREQPAQAPAEPSDVPAQPAKATKPAKAAKTAEPAPWENANPRIPIGFNTKFPEPLHAKLKWLASNVPDKSIQKLVLEAVNLHVEKLLREYYKP